MVEDIGKIISNGFETYSKNLSLCIPFALNAVITGILAITVFGFGFFYLFGSSLSALGSASTPQAVAAILLPVITRHFYGIVILVIIYFLVFLFFQSFFMAGAIGMAQKATETGKSDLAAMIEAGKKNVINLYLAEVLVGLLALAGIVFIVPGAMRINLDQLLSGNNADAVLLLAGGVFLWAIYIAILSLFLAVFSYALVIENLGPIDGIATGFRFFKAHKSDVFLLWVVIGIILIVLMIADAIFGGIPVLNVIWQFASLIINFLIIPPLTTLWWVRLYMTRTGKKMYFNDLLMHPNDLKKLKADQ
jgi:hypothetical protein